mgnify:CR=1 FL=1|jgi:hypothetical protein
MWNQPICCCLWDCSRPVGLISFMWILLENVWCNTRCPIVACMELVVAFRKWVSNLCRRTMDVPWSLHRQLDQIRVWRVGFCPKVLSKYQRRPSSRMGSLILVLDIWYFWKAFLYLYCKMVVDRKASRRWCYRNSTNHWLFRVRFLKEFLVQGIQQFRKYSWLLCVLKCFL